MDKAPSSTEDPVLENVDTGAGPAGGADTAPGSSEDPCSVCPEESRLDDFDCDGDLLYNIQEESAGTDICQPDSDGDGLTDWDEVLSDAACSTLADTHTDPLDEDSDDDGLNDGEERRLGTAPCNPDTDGDGLTDGAEVDAHLDPNEDDTDEDGYADGVELGAGTDATDVDDPELTRPGINDTVETSGCSAVDANTFGATQYYGDGDEYRDGGKSDECHCSFSMTNPIPTEVAGATVWIETAAHHQKTEATKSGWVTTKVPAGVALGRLWEKAESSDPLPYSFSLNNGADREENTESTESGVDYWYAFGHNEVSPSSDEPAPSGAVSLFGTHTVVVSSANTSGEPITFCQHLAHDAGSDYALKLKFNSPHFAFLKTSCKAGSRAITQLGFLNLGQGIAPVGVGRSPHHAGARAEALHILDWRGATRLDLVTAEGRSLSFTAASPAHLIPEGLSLEGATWTAWSGDRPASRPPIVQVSHRCVTSPTDVFGARTVPLSWEVVGRLFRQRGGVDLKQLVQIQQPKETAALTLSLTQSEQAGPQLVIATTGGRTLFKAPAQVGEAGQWSVEIEQSGVSIDAVLWPQENGDIQLVLTKGSYSSPLGTQSMIPGATLLRADHALDQ